MKRRILLLVLLVSPLLIAEAQPIREFYYNKNWTLTKKDVAAYYRKNAFDTVTRTFVGEVKDFTIDGKLIMTGSYSGGKKHGRFVSFFKNGTKESEGPYEEDVRNGSWNYFYQDGSLRYEVEFIKGTPGIRTVRDSTGRVLAENGTGTWIGVYDESPDTRITVKGQLKDYEYEGAWTQSLPDGTIFTSSRFSKGQFLDGSYLVGGKSRALDKPLVTVLPEDFKHRRTESLAQEPDVSNSDYPFLFRKKMARQPWAPVGKEEPITNGEPVYVIVEVSAYPTGGLPTFYKEVASLNKYPKEARRKRIKGTVFVEFVVNPDGSLSDLRVIKGIGGGCDEAALHAVQESQKKIVWIPGIQRRQFVRQRFTLPMIFALK